MAFNNLRASLTGIGFDTVNDIKQALNAQNKSASGKLISDTRFEVIDTGSLLSLTMKAPAYYKYVDEGRKPGGKQPPIGKIQQWIKRKGIDANPFVIARAIARNGIPATGIYTDAIEKTKKNLGLRIGQLAKGDVQKLTLESLKPKN